LSAASSVGAWLIALLHAATAAATCGFELAPPELVELPPDVLVLEPPDVLVLAGVEVDELPPPEDEDEELLLLPHPATTAPLITTTDNNALSLLAIAIAPF
jgi:hypothetical protein